MLIFLEVVFWELWENLSMIRKRVPGFALVFVCLLAKAQAPPSSVAASTYIDAGGAKVWFEECGSASLPRPAVVLLHDGLVHSITWIMRRVHMERAIIVGNSSGGGLALDFALAHPETVEALFLIGPVVHGMASSDYFNERGNQNSAPLGNGDAKAAAENWSKDRFLIAGDDQRARKKLYDALAQNPQNLKVAGEMEIRPSPPTVLRLSQIRVPALILVGEADIGDVFAYSGAIEAAVPLASFEIWKDTGHLIQIQRPAQLVLRFNRFVALIERKEVKVPEQKLAEYVGRYKLFNRPADVILREGHLVLEFPGDPDYWLFAASDAKFFLRTEETEIEFQEDAGGKVQEMVIHNSDGSVVRGPRMDAASPR